MIAKHNLIRDIVYLNHLSTAMECFFNGDSSYPDCLLNIMRDNSMILNSENCDNLQKYKLIRDDQNA